MAYLQHVRQLDRKALTGRDGYRELSLESRFRTPVAPAAWEAMLPAAAIW